MPPLSEEKEDKKAPKLLLEGAKIIDYCLFNPTVKGAKNFGPPPKNSLDPLLHGFNDSDMTKFLTMCLPIFLQCQFVNPGVTLEIFPPLNCKHQSNPELIEAVKNKIILPPPQERIDLSLIKQQYSHSEYNQDIFCDKIIFNGKKFSKSSTVFWTDKEWITL